MRRLCRRFKLRIERFGPPCRPETLRGGESADSPSSGGNSAASGRSMSSNRYERSFCSGSVRSPRSVVIADRDIAHQARDSRRERSSAPPDGPRRLQGRRPLRHPDKAGSLGPERGSPRGRLDGNGSSLPLLPAKCLRSRKRCSVFGFGDGIRCDCGRRRRLGRVRGEDRPRRSRQPGLKSRLAPGCGAGLRDRDHGARSSTKPLASASW